MKQAPWPIAALLPHGGEAVLLDGVTGWDDEQLLATATIRAAGRYAQADGTLPAWLGLEIMAQAIGAWAGCRARETGQPVRLGFLLGTRRYECNVDAFAPGMRLEVHAARTFEDAAGMGVFACALHHEGRLLAQARLNVYSPPDPGAFVHESPLGHKSPLGHESSLGHESPLGHGSPLVQDPSPAHEAPAPTHENPV